MYPFYATELQQLKIATDLKTSSGIGIAIFYFCKTIYYVYY